MTTKCSVISAFCIAVAVHLTFMGFGGRAFAADEWTLMVYLDGDCSLEDAAIGDFLEMSDAGSTSDVNILVLFDRISGYSGAYDDWTGARRGLLEKNDDPDAAWGVDMGELNMGDPQTLVDFVTWGVRNYPANRYAVVLWNHGSGWRSEDTTEGEPPYKSVCFDDTSFDRLDMSEVRDALDQIETDVGEMDLVGFDACLMAMVEVAYEIREHGDVMVGSEKTEPNDGWPWDTILSDLAATPAMSAAQLGEAIVSRYYQSYGNDQAISSISLDDYFIDDLVDKVDSLAGALRTSWNTVPGACAAAAFRVIKALDDHIVLSEEHGSSWPGSHGLAVYFPETSADFSADYNDTVILFPGATEWEEFLQDFYASMDGSWVAEAWDDSQEYDVSSASGMQGHHIDLYDFCRKLLDGAAHTIWVDFTAATDGNGRYTSPYNTLAEAVSAAVPGDTICIKAGSSSETLIIQKALRTEACSPVTIGSENRSSIPLDDQVVMPAIGS